jgi:urease accessory protein
MLQDVMIVRLEALLAQAPEILGRTCLEIGHALGNQHWPAVVKGTAVYVPLTVSQQVMSSVMKTHAFPGITYEFAPGDTVIPYLSPHEARQLFGGANATPHSHIPGEMRYDTVHAHETGHLPVPPHVHGRRHSQGNDHDH